jgi:hypothetical protein
MEDIMFPYTFTHKGVQYTINKVATVTGFDYVVSPSGVKVSIDYATFSDAVQEAPVDIEKAIIDYLEGFIRDNF